MNVFEGWEVWEGWMFTKTNLSMPGTLNIRRYAEIC